MDSFSLVAAPLIDADDLPAGKLHGVLVAEFVPQADDSHLGVRALDQVLNADAACRARHAKQDLAGNLTRSVQCDGSVLPGSRVP